MVSTDQRHDDAIYWARPANDGYPVSGPLNVSPELIKVRWQDERGIFLDLQGREFEAESVIYSGKALELGGFLLRADDLGPDKVENYPPVVPYQLEQYLEYYLFNDNLDGVNGNDLSVTAGALGFDTGVSGNAVYTDGNPTFTIESASDYTFAIPDKLTVAFWLKTDIATALNDAVFNLILLNNLRIDIEAGSSNTIKFSNIALTLQSIISTGLLPDWLDDFNHFAFVWEKGKTQAIFLNGIKQTLTSSSGVYNTDLADGKLRAIATVSSNRDIWLDELRIYNALLDQKQIQTLAAVHPSQYVNAFEIRNNSHSTNLRKTRNIYKSWLSK